MSDFIGGALIGVSVCERKRGLNGSNHRSIQTQPRVKWILLEAVFMNCGFSARESDSG